MAKRTKSYDGAAEQAEAANAEAAAVQTFNPESVESTATDQVNGQAVKEAVKRLHPVRYWVCRTTGENKPPVVVSICKSWRSAQTKLEELKALLGGSGIELVVYKAKIASKPKRQAPKLGT